MVLYSDQKLGMDVDADTDMDIDSGMIWACKYIQR